MKHNRLNREKWIKAGLAALKDGGPDALRAEPLARTLGTTKGSFYWHFDDVPAFQAAVLNHWQGAAFAGVVDLLQQPGKPAARLQAFGEAVLHDSVGPAIRAWARHHKGAARTVAQVDAERLTYMGTLLTALGVTNPEFARAAYGTLVGLPLLPGAKRQDTANAYAALIDLVRALR